MMQNACDVETDTLCTLLLKVCAEHKRSRVGLSKYVRAMSQEYRRRTPLTLNCLASSRLRHGRRLLRQTMTSENRKFRVRLFTRERAETFQRKIQLISTSQSICIRNGPPAPRPPAVSWTLWYVLLLGQLILHAHAPRNTRQHSDRAYVRPYI